MDNSITFTWRDHPSYTVALPSPQAKADGVVELCGKCFWQIVVRRKWADLKRLFGLEPYINFYCCDSCGLDTLDFVNELDEG